MYSPKDHPSTLATSELEEVAEKFAAQLDDKSFTLAEIQGFLLTQKMDPMKALREVEPWKDQIVRSKQEKSRWKKRVSSRSKRAQCDGQSRYTKASGDRAFNNPRRCV